MVFTTKKEKNGVTKNIDINIVSYLISMARSRVPTIVEIETEIEIIIYYNPYAPRSTPLHCRKEGRPSLENFIAESPHHPILRV